MQICGNTSLCHAMHIFHSGITSLQFLLEDSTLVKVSEISCTSFCISFMYIWYIYIFLITDLIFYSECVACVQVGVGISSDCAEVLRDYNVSVKSVEDLSYHANQKLGREPKTWGLRSSKDSCLQRGIYHIMLRCLLSKGHLFGSLSCIFESLFLIVYVCFAILSSHWTVNSIKKIVGI
jgi:hypothetical protein